MRTKSIPDRLRGLEGDYRLDICIRAADEIDRLVQSDWQPIKDAPLTEYVLLSWNTGHNPEDWDFGIAIWHARGADWQMREDGAYLGYKPTHWMRIRKPE